jgi:hypothetical protein
MSYISSMKNISLICLLFCLTILGCDKEKSGTPKSGNGYFMYSITIDGVTHKIEGNLNQNGISPYSGNYCLGTYAGIAGAFGIQAQLGDKTQSSYVSGEYFDHILLLIDVNISNDNNLELRDYEIGSNLSIFPNSANISGINICGFVEIPGSLDSHLGAGSGVGIENFTINSWGTPGSYNVSSTGMPSITYGDPIIGSFSGTVYGSTQFDPNNSCLNQNFDLPIQLEIEFVAPRTIY